MELSVYLNPAPVLFFALCCITVDMETNTTFYSRELEAKATKEVERKLSR